MTSPTDIVTGVWDVHSFRFSRSVAGCGIYIFISSVTVAINIYKIKSIN
jgi:hypothetical protein